MLILRVVFDSWDFLFRDGIYFFWKKFFRKGVKETVLVHPINTNTFRN